MRHGWTWAPAATKRTSAFVHQIVVWRKKSSATGCCGGRGIWARGNPQLHDRCTRGFTAALMQEWYIRVPELSSNRSNMVVCVTTNVQFQLLIPRTIKTRY